MANERFSKHNKKLVELSVQEAIQFINNSFKSTESTTPIKPSTLLQTNAGKNIGNEKVHNILQRWADRQPVNIQPENDAIQGLRLQDLEKAKYVPVCGRITADQKEILKGFDHVYSIPGDHLVAQAQGKGTYVVDVTKPDLTKFIRNDMSKTQIYYGMYTGKQKSCVKLWTVGDIRSYLTLDYIYYKDHFDPAGGRIPTAPVATAMMIRKIKSIGTPVFVGFSLADFNAWDQQIVEMYNMKICT